MARINRKLTRKKKTEVPFELAPAHTEDITEQERVLRGRLVLQSLAKDFPEKYGLAEMVSDEVIEIMDRQSIHLQTFSIESVCYWIRLATYANAVVDEIKRHGIVES